MVKQRKGAQARKSNDALTGDRNEFIGTPVMSGEKAGASGASRKPTRKTPAKAKSKAGRKIPSPKSNLSFGIGSSRKKAAKAAERSFNNKVGTYAEDLVGGDVVDGSDGRASVLWFQVYYVLRRSQNTRARAHASKRSRRP